MIRGGLLARSVLALALPWAMSMVPATAQAQGICPVDSRGHADARGQVQFVKVNDTVAVEQITGDAAFAHLQNVMSRQADAFTEARRAGQARGWQETRTAYVERTITLITDQGIKPGDVITTLPASYSESNAQGEIILWSSDAGTNSVWSGTIYIETYANGAASTWQGEINVATTQYPWIWYQLTWQNQLPKQTMHDGPPPMPGQFLHAVFTDNAAAGARAPGYRYLTYDAAAEMGEYRPADAIGWAKCWRGAVVAGCTAAAIGCIESGPAWPACFGAWCVGVIVGSGVGCALAP